MWFYSDWLVFQNCCVQAEVIILYLCRGLSSCQRTQIYCYVYPLTRNRDPSSSLPYYFLSTPPLFLHSPPSLCAQSLIHVWLFPTPWRLPGCLLCPWNYPGKNTGVGCHFLLQAIFLTQRSNPCLLHLLHW